MLKNVIQEYAWGSHTAIADLLGTASPSDMPQAELWMGAHPKAPSVVKYEGKEISLAELIRRHPEDILGKAAAEKFGSQLPYLFKVLAAAKPLSVQAHPDKNQAVAGFERENEMNIPLNAPNRNYRDAHHKPECICALTPFWALNGFRNIPEILSLTEKICPKQLEKETAELLKHPGSSGLKDFFFGLMTMDPEQQQQIIANALVNAQKYTEDDPVCKWITALHDAYPSDIGVLSPIFLNLICLEPGEAMFLPAGELHSYLDGLGIELMANSDNVLRGGLTPKHIDVPELLKVLNFEERDIAVLLPEAISDYEKVYPGSAEEFVLSVIHLEPGMDAVFHPKSVEILLCIQGQGKIIHQNQAIEIRKGASAIVPASAGDYCIEGELVIYKASVP
jgi:mannose-6-phosphate isomerase